jgi:signal transduction histidine kinase/DNA-binding NarL/FixJ family response regulator
LDFRVSLGSNVAAILRLLFLLGITGLSLLIFAGYFPGHFTMQGLLASLVIITVCITITVQFFPKLLGTYSNRLGNHFAGDRFEYHDKVRAFIREHRLHKTNIAEYLADCVELVSKQFALSAVGVAVFDGDVNARGQSCIPEENRDWPLIFGPKSSLRNWFKISVQPYLDLREGATYTKAEQDARSLMAEQSLVLALAIGVEEQKLIGLLVVGPRKDDRSFNKVDIEVLSLLCNNIAARAERIAVERNEELHRANEAKDQFLANVNHEIRNPLNGINGIVQMLKEYCPEGRAQYLLSSLQTCTDQLRTTMDDVLDFNQLGPEVADNHPTRVDLVEVARSTTQIHDLSGEKLTFEVSGVFKPTEADDSKREIRLWCDPGKFSHILANFLNNALKYGVPPGARIQLHGEAVGADRVRVKLLVASTGPTLSQEEVITLFTPLTRGQRAQETKAHGLGLGLALCRKLAQAMGGNVGVESARGITTFWFVAEFPLLNADNSEANAPLLKVAGRLALAIEDEPYNRFVLGYHLNRFGISPVWAEDGRSALAAAQNRAFDLIIMDWRLPDMDGDELLAKLRASSPTPLPPVVVVSAYSTANKRAASFAAGAAAFVSKPIDESKLAEAFGRCRLGPPVTTSETEQIFAEPIDLSALKAATAGDSNVIESFIREIELSYANLLESWETEPHAAASIAHRLKGQMLLVRARECASLFSVLERALSEKGSSADAKRLVEVIQGEFSGATRAIRSAAGSPRSQNEAGTPTIVRVSES